jgi:Xaa-Pro aminopeptidase
MDLEKIKQILEKMNLDAYLIYDFRGSNHVGRGVLQYHTLTTRRWIAIVTKQGDLHWIVPKLEESFFTTQPGKKRPYMTHQQLSAVLVEILKDTKKVAIDISPENGIAVLDVVPAGFVELLHTLLPETELVPSGDLSQHLASVWDKEQYDTHKKAAAGLEEVAHLTWDLIREKLAKNEKITDLDAENFILDYYKQHAMVDIHEAAVVATNAKASDPHYCPTKDEFYEIKPNSVLLMDIWVKLAGERNIYADCTFMAWIGPDPVPAKVQEVWEVVRDARNLGVEYIKDHIQEGVTGRDVDNAVRKFITDKGYGEYFVHRTGHSIDTNTHGSGANVDGFESNDTRELIPNTGFSIEPGVYLPEFGVRSEIDVFITEEKTVEVTTWKQEELVIL